MISKIIDQALIGLDKLEVQFTAKPIVVGGLAMEYYGLRKKGDDVDLIINKEDYLTLAAKYPDCRKDSWGDLGLKIHDFELFRSIWRLDYDFYSTNAVEYKDYKVISIDKLFLMKSLAANAGEKYKRDFDLIMTHFQNQEYCNYMQEHLQSYLASPDGFVYNGKY